ncbi:MAG: hypothetical protein JJU00_16470 [Opitutales bacterium]|nr:hypothetical protein [Opitutales bacterium]
MSSAKLLGLKQELTKLSEQERREVSAFLIRLGQESAEWKEETARRLRSMEAGEKTSVAELRERFVDHG